MTTNDVGATSRDPGAEVEAAAARAADELRAAPPAASAYIPGLGTVRACIDCGVLVLGGPTRCMCCVERLGAGVAAPDGRHDALFDTAAEWKRRALEASERVGKLETKLAAAVARELAAGELRRLYDGPPWLADIARALGEVAPDGTPLALTWSQAVTAVRELRDRAAALAEDNQRLSDAARNRADAEAAVERLRPLAAYLGATEAFRGVVEPGDPERPRFVTVRARRGRLQTPAELRCVDWLEFTGTLSPDLEPGDEVVLLVIPGTRGAAG